jgi:hypothetical protein
MANSSLTARGRWAKPVVGFYRPGCDSEDIRKCEDVFDENGIRITWQNVLGIRAGDPWTTRILNPFSQFLKKTI